MYGQNIFLNGAICSIPWQTILMKYVTFYHKFGKMSQNLSSAAVVIGALWVKPKMHDTAVGIEDFTMTQNISFCPRKNTIIDSIDYLGYQEEKDTRRLASFLT